MPIPNINNFDYSQCPLCFRTQYMAVGGMNVCFECWKRLGQPRNVSEAVASLIEKPNWLAAIHTKNNLWHS